MIIETRQLNREAENADVKKKINWLGIISAAVAVASWAVNGVVYFARMPSGAQYETFKTDVTAKTITLEGRVGTLQQSVGELKAQQEADHKETIEKLDKLVSNRRR